MIQHRVRVIRLRAPRHSRLAASPDDTLCPPPQLALCEAVMRFMQRFGTALSSDAPHERREPVHIVDHDYEVRFARSTARA
jgi:hypothetical protein